MILLDHEILRNELISIRILVLQQYEVLCIVQSSELYSEGF